LAYLFTYDFYKECPINKVGVEAHQQYWSETSTKVLLGGPWADFNGGAIVFESGDAEEAQGATQGDPFFALGWIESYQLRPWLPKQTASPIKGQEGKHED
jgi:uncharacterized protein YciI